MITILMKKNKALLKQIRLHPTTFSVDVWVCDDIDLLAKCFNKRYGASAEYYKEETTPNQVRHLYTTDKSELKGCQTIVMNINSFDIGIMIHEFNHVIYHLAKICGLETTYDTQEWISYMIEYLYNECSNNKKFTVYNIK